MEQEIGLDKFREESGHMIKGKEEQPSAESSHFSHLKEDVPMSFDDDNSKSNCS